MIKYQQGLLFSNGSGFSLSSILSSFVLSVLFEVVNTRCSVLAFLSPQNSAWGPDIIILNSLFGLSLFVV